MIQIIIVFHIINLIELKKGTSLMDQKQWVRASFVISPMYIVFVD